MLDMITPDMTTPGTGTGTGTAGTGTAMPRR